MSETLSRPKTMGYALRTLSRRRVSTGQMRDLLARKGALPQEIDECVARLHQWGYLDDSSYAKDILEYALAECPIGRRRASFELAKKRFNREVLEEAISAVFGKLTEEELAQQAVQKYLNGRKYSTLEGRERKRLMRWLWRRGFDNEALHYAIRRAGDDAFE